MTDSTPDFRALCAELLAAFEIQLEEMSIDNRLCERARAALATTPPEPLSPKAQAVLDAVCDNTEPDCDTQHLISAALCAVVKACAFEDFNTRLLTAADILAIATELEGQP